MAKAISWVAVNKSGEVCLDSDPSPLPRGWERCLDLQSGVMYLKQMNTSSQSDSKANSTTNNQRGSFHKRKRLLLEDDDGEGDPALQLTLSLPTCSVDTGNSELCRPRSHWFPSNSAPLQAPETARSSMQSHDTKRMVCGNHPPTTSEPVFPCEAHSLITTSQATLPIESIRDATTSSNGSSPSCNASSSSASSSPLYKQFGIESNGVPSNPMGSRGLNQETNLIKARGCPHCFMYVLPSRTNPRCPRCKSSMLVDLSPLTTQ